MTSLGYGISPPKVIRYRKNTSKSYRKAKVATVKVVKNMIRRSEETHIFDVNSAGNLTGNAWTIACLSNVIKGDGVENRTGDKITPLSLRVRCDTHINSSNTGGDTMRVIIFKDKQARGALPSDTDLGLSNGGYENVNHFLAVDNYRGRFVKLYDRVHVYDTSQKYKFFTINKKLKGKIQFGTEGSDYENNSLFIAFCCVENTNKTNLSYKSRLTFKDA